MATPTSEQLQTELYDQAIDELLVNIESFRSRVEEACASFSKRDRQAVRKVDEKTGEPGIFLDMFHDNMLPKLRRLNANSRSKSLIEKLGNAFYLDEEESGDLAEQLASQRRQELLHEYASDASANLRSGSKRHVHKNARALIENKTDDELTDLYQRYLDYITYKNCADYCLVSYVDPHEKRSTRRAAKRRIKQERTSYSLSAKARRENVAYRLEQLSRIYDGLIDVIVANGWNTARLISLRNEYESRIEKSRSSRRKTTPSRFEIFDGISRDFITKESMTGVDKKRAPIELVVQRRADIAAALARIMDLTVIQKNALLASTKEYRELLAEQKRYRVRK